MAAPNTNGTPNTPSPNNVTPSAPLENGRASNKVRTGYVTVGCKIPNGIILQLSTMEQSTEPVMGGGHRDVKIGRKVGERYVIKGPRLKLGEVPTFVMAGGYALTIGVVPEDFWNEWVRQNHDSDIVRNEFVIAHKSVDDVESHCANNAALRTGLEPMDPNNLPRSARVQTFDKEGSMTR
jgi:hypothetical protein